MTGDDEQKLTVRIASPAESRRWAAIETATRNLERKEKDLALVESLLYEHVASDDRGYMVCESTAKMLHKTFPLRRAKPQDVLWIADAVSQPLHVVRFWEAVPPQLLERVLDLVIAELQAECKQLKSNIESARHERWLEA